MRDYDSFLQDFVHTGQSLETFENCPLKFYKRYFEGLRWDRPLDAEERAAIDLGSDFHILAERFFLGIDRGLHEGAEDYDRLSVWLRNLEGSFGHREDAVYLPEYKLRCESGDFKLEANFDLVISHGGKLEIWDWKTHASEHRQGRAYAEKLEKSLQTTVYLYVLKERAGALFGREYDFGDISMNYWQPEPARTITSITYSRQLHERFGGRIAELVGNIKAFDKKTFDKSLYSAHCRYCEFNWFCNREQNSLENR